MSLAGRLVYELWHRPLGAMRHTIRHGGPWGTHETERQRREMEAAACSLAPILNAPGAAIPARPLHILTGARYWWQTAFCLHSFARSASQPVAVELYDDGSLTAEFRDRLLRLGLRLRFHEHAALRDRLEDHLPLRRFPHLRERWLHYPHIRKLVDVHLAETGWKLVIDSDLLFFRRPQFILDWLNTPDRPLYAVDHIESYGYSRALLETLAGRPLPQRLNVGLCGLLSEEIDWEKLEHWTGRLIAAERTSYFLEQALVAMLVAGRTCAIAPVEDYITLPSPSEIQAPRAIMHHYVDTAKRGYYRQAWRRFAEIEA